MAAWTDDELDRMGNAEELTLASERRDGALRQPVTMWVVRDGDDIFVRSVNGRGSSWFRGAQARHQARIRAGGIEKDVGLVGGDPFWASKRRGHTRRLGAGYGAAGGDRAGR